MAEQPQGRGEIASLLRRHGVAPRKSLGQHFLADPNVIRKVVRLADLRPGERALEVGAGTGTLTRALAASGAPVRAYEIDERLRPVLAEALRGVDVDLRFADVMEIDLCADLGAGPWVMVSNLPYQVGTPLLLDLLRGCPAVTRYVVMVQREVGDRLRAAPGTRAYGLPSVVAGLYAEEAGGFRVSPAVFHPRPRVESSVVVLRRRAAIPADAVRAVQLAAAAFNQRRKMIRSSLAGHLGDVAAVAAAAGVEATARAEHLSPEDYLALARAEEANAGEG